MSSHHTQQQQKGFESFAYGASEDPGLSSSSDGGGLVGAKNLRVRASQKMQVFLDRSVPHTGRRWMCWCLLVATYFLRAYLVHGYYIVTYGLGIYNLNLTIGFLSPARDPAGGDGPTLPSSKNEEYR